MMQFMFAGRRGRRVLQRFSLQQTATLSTRVPTPVSHVRRVVSPNGTPLIKTGNFTIGRFVLVQSNQYSAATTNDATKQPKKKAKKATKKPAKSTKPKLTPEEKERKKEKAKNLKITKEIGELKAQALLKEEPKALPSSAWTIFLASTLKGTVGKQTVASFKECADAYKNLPSSEREEFEQRALSNREENQRAHAAWIKSYTPLQIKTANNARRRLASITAEHRKRVEKHATLKDDRLVKPPLSPYMIFSIERSRSGDLDNTSFKERADRINQEWKSLSEHELERYNQLKAEDKERYIKQYRETYGKEPYERQRKYAKSDASSSP